jgi:hypothetical protein
MQDVRRFVYEVAGQRHAVAQRQSPSPCLARGRGIREREGESEVFAPILTLLALGFVALERIGAQRGSEGEIGCIFRFQGPSRQVGDNGRVFCAARNPAEGGAPELCKIPRFCLLLAETQNDQPG